MALLPRQAAAEAARAPGALLRTCPPPAAPFLAPPRPAPRQPGLRRPVPAAEAAVRLHPLPCSANADAVSTDASGLDATFEPEDARGAISMGLKLHDGGRYEEALQMFQRAVELPGTGLKRYRDKPNLISDGEKQACMYNIACCHSKLGNVRDGLVAVAICLEAGYQDFDQLQTDPDLEDLRKDERFTGLLSRFQPEKSSGGIFGQWLKGFRP